jgi:type I restriction enzyme M protein
VLSFLFLSYLSDNYEAAAKRELGSDYPSDADVAAERAQFAVRRAEAAQKASKAWEKARSIDDISSEPTDAEPHEITTPLQLWYSRNAADVVEFEKQMRRKVHYVIEPQFFWNNIAELARVQSDVLLKTLYEGFKYIENESFQSTFGGLFSEINLYSEKLGKTQADKNKKLCLIIAEIAKGLAEFSNEVDHLGDAYEYLIGQFAAGSGKKAGEFYTPQQISDILSAIVTLDSQEPATGQKERLESVLDFACGSGSLLLNVRKRMGAHGIGKIFGQESNITTYNLARMNML